MLEFESKRKFKKRLYSKLTLLILIAVFVFVAHGTWGIFQKQRMVSSDLENSEQILEKHSDRKLMLEDRLERINSDVGKEELLRDKYSVAKEGERAVFILDSDEEIEIIDEEKGFFDRVGSFFSGLFN